MTYNNPPASGDHSQVPSSASRAFHKRRLQPDQEQSPIEEIDTHEIPVVMDHAESADFIDTAKMAALSKQATPQPHKEPTQSAASMSDVEPRRVADEPTMIESTPVTAATVVEAPVEDIAQQQTARQKALTPAQYEHQAEQGMPVISVRHLSKTYQLGKETRVQALRGISLDVYPGEFVAVLGPSGSGKSTFMNLIGCLDRPSGGEYRLAGKLVSKLSSNDLADVRNRLIGFVFQGFNLLSRATALKNVALPMVYAGLTRTERENRARRVLKLVGLGARITHKPSELSGGQQQRVAIARALVNGPSLLLADEPTGNLDSRTSVEIMAVLQALNNQGLTIILVTHDLNVADYARRQVSFLDGAIVRDEMVKDRRYAQDEWASLNKKMAEETQATKTRAATRTTVKEESV
jgi:putative ABC transport system ATP-binding protein